MKHFRIIGRNISDAFKGVFRNFSLSLASISSIAITLILVGFAIIVSYNINNFANDIEKDVTIVAFIDRKTENKDSLSIKEKILKLPNIASVVYKSKEEVKRDMQKQNEVFDNIMSEYDATSNPLQDTYSIKVKDINNISKTASDIKKMKYISSVKYGEGMVEELVSTFNIVKKVTFIVVIALIFVTAFLISNTIKITISNRKREIEIMRLVGASNTYIKMPFFFEGVILGALGSILPIFICGYGYVYFYEKFGGNFFSPIISLVNPDQIILNIVILVLVIAISVGALGSYRAVKKYLKI